MSIISERLLQVKPSETLRIISKSKELKAQGLNILELAAGEPDFPTPQNVKDAAKVAIDTNKTIYTPVDGVLELKKAIAAKFKRENNIDYEVNEIIVGTGAKQVLYNALMASINPGDEVVIPAPYWVSYPDMVILAGGKPVTVLCPQETGFKLTAQALQNAITPKTKWLILNSPSNPTGSVYSKEELLDLSRVLLNNPHVYVMMDDIYEHVLYDGEFYTMVELEPALKSRVLTVNGVSKSYCMTGWRIGYGAGPADLIKAMGSIQSQSTSNPCSISQYASIEALNGPQDFIDVHNERFLKRRDMALEIFNSSGLISAITPGGAFYIFSDCSKLFGKKTPKGDVIKNSSDFCGYLIEHALVATVQGSAFGMEGFFRISYATDDAVLKEACEKIVKAARELV